MGHKGARVRGLTCKAYGYRLPVMIDRAKSYGSGT